MKHIHHLTDTLCHPSQALLSMDKATYIKFISTNKQHYLPSIRYYWMIDKLDC